MARISRTLKQRAMAETGRPPERRQRTRRRPGGQPVGTVRYERAVVKVPVFRSAARQKVADELAECGVAVLEPKGGAGNWGPNARAWNSELQSLRLQAREVATAMGAQVELQTVRDDDGPYIVATLVRL